ncbi:MAG: HAD family hydrolase [Desulfovibrio sp.]
MKNISIEPHVQAVLFDCDGVLLSSWNSTCYYFNSIREHVGLGPMSPEEEKRAFVSTVSESIGFLVPEDKIQQAVAFAHSFPIENLTKRIKLNDGIEELLQELKKNDIKTAVVTNGENEARDILAYFGLDKWFDTIVTAADVEKGKPHPMGAQKALDICGVKPENALFVGDGPTDMGAANAAGVTFWCYENEELECAEFIESFRQIKLLSR